MTAPLPGVARLEAGIVGFDDGDRIGAAIDSLAAQQLPGDVRLERIWVVAGGRGPGTVESARIRAEVDPRIVVIEETERRGKSVALAEVCARAQGDWLVLLNGDARALPGSVAALLRTAAGAQVPYGVMARPVLAPEAGGSLQGPLNLLWRLHHELHAELSRTGRLDHLSDELLLLPTAALPPFAEGIVNDGTFAADWIRGLGGRLLYAESAQVEVAPPTRIGGHIRQRRRIRRGNHHQAPRSTWAAFAVREPRRALQLLGGILRTPRALADLTVLVVAEFGAAVGEGWDLIVQRDYARWTRISTDAIPSGTKASAPVLSP